MTKTRKSDRRRTAGTRLRFEVLEARSLLAVASFHVNLYQDVDGAPGQLISDDTVQAGQTFWAEITAREHDPCVAGLQGVALDIGWDERVISMIAPFRAKESVTQNLPLAVTGELQKAPVAMRSFWVEQDLKPHLSQIVDLGGSAFPAWGVGKPIGSDGDDRYVTAAMQGISTTDDHFAWLRFQATGAGQTQVFLRQGGSSIATMPVSSLGSAQLAFEPQTITVVANHASGIPSATAIVSAAADEAEVELPAESKTTTNLAEPPASDGLPGDGAASDLDVEDGIVLTDGDATVPVTWRNPANPHDVDGRDGVTALDVLIPVNYINAHPDELSLPGVRRAPPPYYDVNGDKFCTAHDALLVLNFVERLLEQVGQGEGEMSGPPESAAAAANAQAGANKVPAVTGLDALASFVPAPELRTDSSLGRAFGMTVPRPDALQRWSLSRNDQQTGRGEPAARIRPAAKDALFGSPMELDAALARIEEAIDAVAAGWADSEDDASCPRDGKTFGGR